MLSKDLLLSYAARYKGYVRIWYTPDEDDHRGVDGDTQANMLGGVSHATPPAGSEPADGHRIVNIKPDLPVYRSDGELVGWAYSPERLAVARAVRASAIKAGDAYIEQGQDGVIRRGYWIG